MVRELSAEKRARLLAAALQLFVQKGIPHTATAEIARAAGIASGTLFLYFPSKQDLIDALVLKISQEQSAAIRSRLRPELPARETFSAIWHGSVNWFLENPDAYQYNQQVREGGIVSPEVVQASARNLSYYFEAIQKGLAEDAIGAYPVELVGNLFYQDIVAVMNMLHNQPDPAQQETLIRLGFEIFWRGIQSGPAASIQNEEF
jgi:AcrR family transcriptional regulator